MPEHLRAPTAPACRPTGSWEPAKRRVFAGAGGRGCPEPRQERRTSQCLRGLAASLVFGMAAAAQQTWKVDCTGAPGSHFTDLPAAVAAAAPGDTILVYNTIGVDCVAAYAPPYIDKPLHIACFTVGGPPGNNTPGGVEMDGALHVARILAGQQVVMTNIGLSHSSASPSSITVSDCAGSVVLDNVYFGNPGMSGQSLNVLRSDHVVGGRLPNTTGTAPSNFAVASQFTTPAPSLMQVDARVPPFSYAPSQAPVVTPIHETSTTGSSPTSGSTCACSGRKAASRC